MVTIDDKLYPKRATSTITAVEVRGDDVLYSLGVLNPGAYQQPLTFSGRKLSEEAVLPVGTIVNAIVLDTDENNSSDIIKIHTLFGVKVQDDSPYFDAYRSKKLPWLATGVVYDITDEGNRDVVLNHPAPIPRTAQAYHLLYFNAKDTRIHQEQSFSDVLRRVEEQMRVTCLDISLRNYADVVEITDVP